MGRQQGLPRDRAGEAQSRHRRSTSGSIRAGRPYYWIEEGENEWEPHDRSDYQAVRDGYISITPLQPDMTAHDALKYLEELPLEAPTPARSS